MMKPYYKRFLTLLSAAAILAAQALPVSAADGMPPPPPGGGEGSAGQEFATFAEVKDSAAIYIGSTIQIFLPIPALVW